MSRSHGSTAGELLFPHFLEAIVHLAFALANPSFSREKHMAAAAADTEKGAAAAAAAAGGGGTRLVPVQVALAALLKTHLAPRAQEAAAALARWGEVGALEVGAVLA